MEGKLAHILRLSWLVRAQDGLKICKLSFMMTKKTSQRRFWRGKKASWRPKKKVLMPTELDMLPTERDRWSDGASGEGKEGVNPSGTGLTRACRYLNTPRTLSGYGEFNGYAVIPPTPHYY